MRYCKSRRLRHPFEKLLGFGSRSVAFSFTFLQFYHVIIDILWSGIFKCRDDQASGSLYLAEMIDQVKVLKFANCSHTTVICQWALEQKTISKIMTQTAQPHHDHTLQGFFNLCLIEWF